MNITLERTEKSIVKYELKNAIKFNNRLLKEVSGSSFLFSIMGRYNGSHLITFDHLITKYENESDITVLQRKVIENITKVHLSMIVFRNTGLDNSTIIQWIAETEDELVELVSGIGKTEEE